LFAFRRENENNNRMCVVHTWRVLLSRSRDDIDDVYANSDMFTNTMLGQLRDSL
jgi:hypothetical protein